MKRISMEAARKIEMTAQTQIDPTVYGAARQTAVFADRSRLGMLKITGESRLDLIDRMSTQAVKRLGSGQGAATILTTEIGRIIDRIILYASSDIVYALTSENHADQLARYLLRFVFFNDDFHVEDISEQTSVFAIYGPAADEMLQSVGFPEVDLPLHHWRQREINGLTLYLHRTDPIIGHGYYLMGHSEDKEAMHQLLLDQNFVFADEDAFDYLRVRAGLPRFGHELTLDYIPLEANLWDDVSLNKGCYIGQEIIARMESRGRLAKQLIKLTPAQPVTPGADIMASGKKVGTITSVAVGPDGPVALGYVKTAVLPGQDPDDSDSPELYVGDILLDLASP
jgi:tRNA-modifying protein YgfZ